ncbi:MAG: TonB-dependent receptor [Acidobacteria bacterium]|nr:TonB-dependent receptor [Acidobacteriota bacterium]
MPRFWRDAIDKQKWICKVMTLAVVALWFGGTAFAQNGLASRPEGQDAAAIQQKPETEAADSEDSRAATNSTASQINESQLVGLPLNGRSYSQLATLQGGISNSSSASASRGTSGGGLNVVGGRSTSNSFLLDGTNIMDSQNRVPQSAAGVQLGSDAVLQVQVFSANYGANYGRGSGGVLNSITRSGTPEFHGNLFEYFRNSKLDARNFFDFGPEPPPFKRNQFGFTLTGPIRQERTFFMAGFEAMRDRLSESNIDYYPDQQARLGIITDTDGGVTKVTQVDVNPDVVPYLKLIPIPTGQLIGRGMAEYEGVRFLPTDENFFTVRVDHKISDRDSFFTRYTFDDATSVAAQGAVDFSVLNNSRQQYLTLVESHIFSPRLLTSLRFGYTRPAIATDNRSTIDIPTSLYFVPDAPKFGTLRLPGMTGFGHNLVAPETNTGNTFQFAGDLLVERGAHAIKTGMELHRYRWDTSSSWNKGGSWVFNSIESFLAGGGPGTSLTVALPDSNNSRAFRQTLAGLYVHDSYNVSSDLQINLGLRYELATLIHDTRERTASLLDPARDSQMRKGPFLDHNPSVRNFAPRLGITWAPAAAPNTVITAGFGIYYDQLLEYVVDARKNSAPFYTVIVKQNFTYSPPPDTFLNALDAAKDGTPSNLAQVLDHSALTTPMVLRYNFSIQHQLPGEWRTQASYVGARGNHLFRTYEMNLAPVPVVQPDGSLFFPPYDPRGPDNRVNPAFGAITMLGSDAQSFYNSLQLSLSKRSSRGNSVQASYTLSKSVDDASSSGGDAVESSTSSQYGLRRTLDRGLSDFDIRHRFVVSYFYSLPFGQGRAWLNSGFLSTVFGGWRVGGIMSRRAGTPYSIEVRLRKDGYLFSATRPNLVPGRSNNPVIGDRLRYFDVTAFSAPPKGTLGNLGRNTVIGPGEFNMDISLQKEFSIDSRRRLEFRAEIFNLPNHTNFSKNTSTGVVVLTGDPDSPKAGASAGRVDKTSSTARQIQFALRLSF